MAETKNHILSRMLERLFAAIVSGPSLSCRPHSSRQRIDLTQLAKLGDITPGAALLSLLSPDSKVLIPASVPAPPGRPSRGKSWSAARDSTPEDEPDPNEKPEARRARQAWNDQGSLLSRLRIIAEEAATYEDDTGVSVLNIGFPLLSLPPAGSSGAGSSSRRILAPIAFIPVALSVRTGVSGGVTISCLEDEIDRVQPNLSLLSWIEQQTGTKLPELAPDEEGSKPWREIRDIVAAVAAALRIEKPAIFTGEPPAELSLSSAPRAEDDELGASIVPAAVLGLFPAANQSLLRDTQALLDSPLPPPGPIGAFTRAGVSLEALATDAPRDQSAAKTSRVFSSERLVTEADPCQARAVALAQTCPALVIHGPPGTGKSQTITNIIADHLAGEKRVLFVCDKRTALDVVAARLKHLGLGHLCALVHDPQRDQRDLYLSIREQLESLAQTRTDPRAEHELSRVDAELASLHAELTDHHRLLMQPPPAPPAPTASPTPRPGDPLCELIGRWLAIPPQDFGPASPTGASVGLTSPEELEAHTLDLADAFHRAQTAGLPQNPWRDAAGLSVTDFLARPMEAIRAALESCAPLAASADEALEPASPPFPTSVPLATLAKAREEVAQLLSKVLQAAPPPIRTLWATRDAAALRTARKSLTDAEPQFQALRAGVLDAELASVLRAAPPTIPQLAQRLGAIENYLVGASRWYAPLLFSANLAAREVLTPLGLPLSLSAGQRARAFLLQARAALTLADLRARLEGNAASASIPDPAELDSALCAHAQVVKLLSTLHDNPALKDLDAPIRAALAAPSADPGQQLAHALDRSVTRALRLADLETAMLHGGLFAREWVAAALARFTAGAPAAPEIATLRSCVHTLEDVLRIRDIVQKLPPSLRFAVTQLLGIAPDPDQARDALRRAVLAGEISRRLAAAPRLFEMDARRLQSIFTRCRELESRKHTLVRDAILHRWTERQRQRLLVGTLSRLNSAGADLKRRLTTRGSRALRLRQVLALGRAAKEKEQNTEAGDEREAVAPSGTPTSDPLMDLRPVWMASPETVAQLFPREPLFDIVIFDEASQCRLEEALPVLTRAGRVVIAGDPRQLPPSRFFESGVAASDGDEIQTDEDLFDAQQGEVEDLLSAALNLDIQSSYLDVHYRSRNADLIAFSNEQFYSSRLQPIPGHPSRVARYAPITLYHAQGVYDKRANAAEADQVVRVIRDLLRRADPPSIGVGCFNITQRDLIAEKLDEAATADPDFAARLAAARSRRGSSSFEGLFVKNLENVQGDERDHIIISTTYGPDPQGRFYRRFGPLAQPGGGRRLNVLVTRARHEVHLVTSIPQAIYQSLPLVPQGQQPGGGWLLFAYLNYAERLAALYDLHHQEIAAPAAADLSAANSPAPNHPTDAAPSDETPEPSDAAAPEPTADAAPEPAAPPAPPITILESRTPSLFAQALGHTLARNHRAAGTVHWGNDGFCIDLALAHPVRPDDVTIGVLADLTRFDLADDPVEWEIFRTSILTATGWTLHRLWSPAFFRDPRGSCDAITHAASEFLRNEKPPDALPVVPPPPLRDPRS